MDISIERLRELVFQAAGAATAPLLEDHPKYEFPSDRVKENVERVLEEFEIPREEDEAEMVEGLSTERVLEIARSEGLTREGESVWVRQGFVVIGPSGRKPAWLPLYADSAVDELVTDAAQQPAFARLEGFVREVLGPQGGVVGISRKAEGGWLVSSEFGQEAPDSPMAGGAIYGSSDDLDEALDKALSDAGR